MSAPVKGLAAMVAVSLDGRPEDTCAAWIHAADRVCGKPATSPWLCQRHERVALRRLDKAAEKERAERERRRAKVEQMRPRWEALLASVEGRLDAIDPLRREGRRDGAMVNLPLSSRLPSESRIAELAKLHAEREGLRMRLGLSRDGGR